MLMLGKSLLDTVKSTTTICTHVSKKTVIINISYKYDEIYLQVGG